MKHGFLQPKAGMKFDILISKAFRIESRLHYKGIPWDSYVLHRHDWLSMKMMDFYGFLTGPAMACLGYPSEKGTLPIENMTYWSIKRVLSHSHHQFDTCIFHHFPIFVPNFPENHAKAQICWAPNNETNHETSAYICPLPATLDEDVQVGHQQSCEVNPRNIWAFPSSWGYPNSWMIYKGSHPIVRNLCFNWLIGSTPMDWKNPMGLLSSSAQTSPHGDGNHSEPSQNRSWRAWRGPAGQMWRGLAV